MKKQKARRLRGAGLESRLYRRMRSESHGHIGDEPEGLAAFADEVDVAVGAMKTANVSASKPR
jgi:hypothetical protein